MKSNMQKYILYLYTITMPFLSFKSVIIQNRWCLMVNHLSVCSAREVNFQKMLCVTLISEPMNLNM